MKKHISLNLRLLIVTICIAFPIIMVILWSGFQEKNSQLKEKIAKNQSEVLSALSQVDTMLELLQKSINNLALDDSDFKMIASEQEPSTDFWLANQRVIQRLSSLTNVIDIKFTPFAYYPAVPLFYNYKSCPEMAEFIVNQAAEENNLSVQKRWSTVWRDENAYIYFSTNYKSYYLGAWGNYNFLGNDLNTMNEDGVTYCFTDFKGKVLNKFQSEYIPLDSTLYSNLNGEEFYISYSSSVQADFYLVRLSNKKMLEATLPGVVENIFIVVTICVMLFIVYVISLYRWVLSPMNYLRKSMEFIQLGNMDYKIPLLRNGSLEFDAVIQEFNYLMSHIENLKIEVYEATLQQNQTKLDYLSRQIQPHFILNTLNTLYNYSEKDVKTAKEIILLASGYYRYVINVNSKYVRLDQELEHIANYLHLQKIRYPSTFVYKIECEDALKIIPIPPFVIESFVGNAVKHGIKPGRQSEICVKVIQIQRFLIKIQIEDRGDGFSEDSLDSIHDFLINGIVSEELGIGIRNSVERLHLIYEDRCAIHIYNCKPHGAVVEIELKLQEDEYGDTGIDCR